MARQGRQCRVRELVLPLWLNFAARFRGNVRACAITCTMPRQRFVQSKPTNHGGRLPLVLANGRVGPRSQRSHMFFLRLVIYTRAGLHDRDDSRGQGGEGEGREPNTRSGEFGRAKIDEWWWWWGWPWALKLSRAVEKSASMTTCVVQSHVDRLQRLERLIYKMFVI